MLDLSPTKILIIVVVALLLLGPKRIPEIARQLGAGWRKLRTVQQRVDAELRQSIPDLPTRQELVRYARSPISVLNRLAELPDAADPAGVTSEGPDTAGGRGEGPDGAWEAPLSGVEARLLGTDDPQLN